MKISEGYPQYFRSVSNENVEGLSTIFSECVQRNQRVVHSIFGVCPMKISKGCPQYFRSVSNEKY